MGAVTASKVVIGAGEVSRPSRDGALPTGDRSALLQPRLLKPTAAIVATWSRPNFENRSGRGAEIFALRPLLPWLHSMSHQGLSRAKLKHEEADYALHQLKCSLRFDVMHAHWMQFLIAAHGAQMALERVAQATAEGRQWWGGIKRRRKADPLLNYMFQARHAAEHGIEDLLAPGPNPRGLPHIPECTHILTSKHSEQGCYSMIDHGDGTKSRRRVSPPDAILLPVHNDKWDQSFLPPRTHLGKPLRRLTPLRAGQLWLVEIRRLVEDAETRFA
jgi:hypothetical protein